ncbi:MAG TPA: exodeoxyribonuclease VII large subunit [Ignavibacteriaceae bacterium]|nr:exodeoxyribonuclease VII large subunit [Ignavibacteriaceae bacterium]
MLQSEILTVSQLTQEIKSVIEENFLQVAVVGELSNFKSHVSGHWYFNLKDANAVINCTMWKGINSSVYFTPQDGMKVIVTGRVTVYPPRGNYQIDVRSMKPAGVGELQIAFEQLKQKLAEEGLFNEGRKRSIPQFPQRIGIVTAIDGAALKDMINIASRRYPLTELVIAPSKVQGAGAAESIAAGIKLLNTKKKIDLIIVARGGGSIEDLWAFNEEIVARAIFNSRLPVISGVGHEIDFTIADFVADLRAPTPSAAMELVTPDVKDISLFLKETEKKYYETIEDKILVLRENIYSIFNSYSFQIPMNLVRQKYQESDHILYKLFQVLDKKILAQKNKLALLKNTIAAFDIQKSLKRGFVLVSQDSKFITRYAEFNRKKKSILNFFDGKVEIQ